MRYSHDKTIAARVLELLKEGWVVARKGGAHWIIQSPCGRKITVPGTPSDGRAAANFIADTRRINRARHEREAAGQGASARPGASP